MNGPQQAAVHIETGRPTDLRQRIFTSPSRNIDGPGEMTFLPTTSTIIIGERDAVLVDAQFHSKDVASLADMIVESGRRLTTIFITHGHADHYFGIERLVSAFPGARVVAAPGVAEYIAANHDKASSAFVTIFGGRIDIPSLLPTPLDSNEIELEGHKLHVLEIGQADISPSTALWVPSIAAAIVGDIAYNGIHVMLALTGPAEWAKWVESIAKVEELRPKTVVVGHKVPGNGDDDVPSILGNSRAYIEDFARAVDTSNDPAGIVAIMRERYPTYGNLTTLFVSAASAIKAGSRSGRTS